MLRLRRSLPALVTASVVVVVLAGCSGGSAEAPGVAGPSTSTEEGLTLEQVQEAGRLVVGTEGTYRPFSFHEGGAGDLTGYDVEVIQAVADELGVAVEFQETQWDAMFAGLDAGRFDLIANQVSINDAREEKYDLSEAYTVSPGVLVVADGSDITSFDDLEGRTSAQSLTSNWHAVAKSNGASVEAVEGWAQAVELLRQGRVDATVNDSLTFLDAQQNGDTAGIRIAAESDEASRSAFALRKGSDSLVDAIDEALDALRADGRLAEISEKYFGADVSR